MISAKKNKSTELNIHLRNFKRNLSTSSKEIEHKYFDAFLNNSKLLLNTVRFNA